MGSHTSTSSCSLCALPSFLSHGAHYKQNKYKILAQLEVAETQGAEAGDASKASGRCSYPKMLDPTTDHHPLSYCPTTICDAVP